jgi:hypothetical protein
MGAENNSEYSLTEDFREDIMTVLQDFKKINHIRKRTYLLIIIITLIMITLFRNAFTGSPSNEFWYFATVWNNTSSNTVENYAVSLILFLIYMQGIFIICRFALMIFAYTTKDTHNFFKSPNYENIKDHYIGELGNSEKANFLFDFSPADDLDSRLYIPGVGGKNNSSPLVGTEFWAKWILSTVYMLTPLFILLGYVLSGIGEDSFDYGKSLWMIDIWASFLLTIYTPLVATMNHIFVSFLDVKSRIRKKYAEELKKEFEKSLQKISEKTEEE